MVLMEAFRVHMRRKKLVVRESCGMPDQFLLMHQQWRAAATGLDSRGEGVLWGMSITFNLHYLPYPTSSACPTTVSVCLSARHLVQSCDTSEYLCSKVTGGMGHFLVLSSTNDLSRGRGRHLTAGPFGKSVRRRQHPGSPAISPAVVTAIS